MVPSENVTAATFLPVSLFVSNAIEVIPAFFNDNNSDS